MVYANQVFEEEVIFRDLLLKMSRKYPANEQRA